MTKSEIAWMMLGVLCIGIFIGVAASCIVVVNSANAEEELTYQCWVLCEPESDVLIRTGAGKRYSVCGSAMCGQLLWTDWKEKNGWLHIVDLKNETGEGWIYEGYVVFEEPDAVDKNMQVTGCRRVACRRWIDGKRKGWAKSGSSVFVYVITSEWAVTNKGYIQSDYLKNIE